MKTNKILIVDDNQALVSSLQKFLEEKGFDIYTANDGFQAVAMAEQVSPEFVLLDIVMPELDGYGVLSALNIAKTAFKPTVIMMSQLNSDGFISKSLRYGASYFLAKPFTNQTLLDTINDFLNPVEIETIKPQEVTKPTAKKSTSSLDEKIANIFISVGIPAHIKGYQFLREAIKLAVENPEIINSITKRLYPSIATRFDTSPSKVERAIRHAIEVAWNRGKIENINMLFGFKVYSANEKPTNGEFIALVADKMLLEGA